MATFNKRNWVNGQQPAINNTNLNALESDIQTFGNNILEEANNNVITKLGYDQYSNEETYDIGDYCIHNNTLYVCTTAITTPEDFSTAKWTATSIAELTEQNQERINTNANNITKGGVRLYKLAETGDLSTGTITLADNVNNYVALVVVTGYVTDGNIDSHIIVPWVSQLDASGNFAGWRVRTLCK